MNHAQRELEAEPCGLAFLHQKLRALSWTQIEVLLTQLFFALYLDESAEENIVDPAACFPESGYRMARETFESFRLAPPSRRFCFDAATRIKGKERRRQDAETSFPFPTLPPSDTGNTPAQKSGLTGGQPYERISIASEVCSGISLAEPYAPAGCVGCAFKVVL